jgi:hypothetical protein
MCIYCNTFVTLAPAALSALGLSGNCIASMTNLWDAMNADAVKALLLAAGEAVPDVGDHEAQYAIKRRLWDASVLFSDAVPDNYWEEYTRHCVNGVSIFQVPASSVRVTRVIPAHTAVLL